MFSIPERTSEGMTQTGGAPSAFLTLPDLGPAGLEGGWAHVHADAGVVMINLESANMDGPALHPDTARELARLLHAAAARADALDAAPA